MLRLIRSDEVVEAPHSNDLLRAALDRVTLGTESLEGHFIFDEGEAQALCRVLASRQFTQDQLEAWIDRLLADHPYDRQRIDLRAGFRVWFKWVLFGGEKPKRATTESAIAWRRRAEAFVDKQITRVDNPSWLERPLQDLDNVRRLIERETGKTKWAMPVIRWALIQLLTPPADTDSAHATG